MSAVAKTFSKLQMMQNLQAIFTLLLCLVMVMLCIPALEYQPRGLAYRVSDKKFAPTEVENVKKYKRRPYGSELIGKVSGELAAISSAEEQQQVMINFARARAAQLGGNGVVIHLYMTQGRVILLEADVIYI